MALAGVSAVGRDGHTVLISPTGEMVRLSLAADAQVRALSSRTLVSPGPFMHASAQAP